MSDTGPTATSDAARPNPASGALRAARRRLAVWRGVWPVRLIFVIFIAAAIAVIWATNTFLTERFTEATRSRAEVRQALYSGQVLSELQRTAVVPLLLARDPELIRALDQAGFALTSQRLISAQREIGASSIELLAVGGRVVAATDRTRLGLSLTNDPAFVQAERRSDTVFSVTEPGKGGFGFIFSRAVLAEGRRVGAIMVSVDLSRFERAWAGESDAVAILDSTNRIILATEPMWRGLPIAEALSVQSAPSAIRRAIQATTDWANHAPDAYVQGVAVMRSELRIPFQGWRLVSFTSYDSIRDRVNAVLALEIMGFALFVAAASYFLSRRALVETALIRRESAELRLLNARLQREVAEREKAQKDLAVVEQTLAQSSKLAALGEMSAAVSHELNQPLAAMKTYLAGARLLVSRQRTEEAVVSFQRINDLIDRMGAITRQLKSYASKATDATGRVDLREAVATSLAMMEPQFRQRAMRLNVNQPDEPVEVLAERFRIEQVIINLLRNAVDATRKVKEPQIDVILTEGENVTLAVCDNGPGITDLDALFEPFYTTKGAGDGLGLGLAISSSIVGDLGGRLKARNRPEGGAVFEMVLPRFGEDSIAAE